MLTDATQRQALINMGQDPDAEFSAGQTQLHDQQRLSYAAQQDRLGAINSFYDDPQHGQQIEQANQLQYDQGINTLGQQYRQGTRQSAFDAARKGQTGGTLAARNQGALNSAFTGGAQALSAQQQFSNQQQKMGLEEARQKELMAAYMQNPYDQAAFNALMSGYGVQQQGAQQQYAGQQAMDQVQQFGNDEFSRALGSGLNSWADIIRIQRGY